MNARTSRKDDLMRVACLLLFWLVFAPSSAQQVPAGGRDSDVFARAQAALEYGSQLARCACLCVLARRAVMSSSSIVPSLSLFKCFRPVREFEGSQVTHQLSCWLGRNSPLVLLAAKCSFARPACERAPWFTCLESLLDSSSDAHRYLAFAIQVWVVMCA